MTDFEVSRHESRKGIAVFRVRGSCHSNFLQVFGNNVGDHPPIVSLHVAAEKQVQHFRRH